MTGETRRLGDVACGALDLAARETPAGEVVETGRVFLALARVDIHRDWSRLWLHTGYPRPGVLLAEHDADTAASGSVWAGKPLSAELARALTLAEDLAAGYDMSPAPPGLVVLALLASPDSAPSKVLSAGIGHQDLLRVVQDELLGTTLENLDQALAGARTGAPATEFAAWRGRAAAIAGGRESDDLDLLAVLVAAGELDREPSAGLIGLALEWAEQARGLGGRTEADVVEAARREFAVFEPSGGQLLFALADRPSPALSALLAVAGTSPRQVAAGAVDRAENGGGKPKAGRSLEVWSLLNMTLSLIASALVVRGAVVDEQWWQLVFLPVTLLGPPAVTTWLPGALSAPIALVNPLAGLAIAVDAVLGWIREGVERRALTARTGVRLTRAEHRNWTKHRSYLRNTMAQRATALLRWRAARLVGAT